MKTLKTIIKGIFTLKWVQDNNIVQNIIMNLYLPDSTGKPSLQSTLLIVAGIIPLLTALGVEIYLATKIGRELSTGFWAVIGTLSTAISGLYAVREYQRKKNRTDSTNFSKKKQLLNETFGKVDQRKIDPKPNLEK